MIKYPNWIELILSREFEEKRQCKYLSLSKVWEDPRTTEGELRLLLSLIAKSRDLVYTMTQVLSYLKDLNCLIHPTDEKEEAIYEKPRKLY